jgi:hypothetical protein
MSSMRTQLVNRHASRRILLFVAGLAVAACQGVAAPSNAPASPVATAPASAGATPVATPPGLEIVGAPFVAPVAACAGPKPWTGVPAIVVRLAEAWHERDGEVRRGILTEVWATTSVYQDPYGSLAMGVDAFSEVMGHGVAPGQYIELRSWNESDVLQGSIRMAWRHCCPSGLSLLEGVDLLTLGPDGRIASNVSFWSRYVEEPAEGACDGPPAAATGAASAAPAGTSCKGSDVDWSALPEVGAKYARAWNERDPAARRALLDEVWADDGSFADQTYDTPVVGRKAFASDIGEFQDAEFGAYFEPRPLADGDVHHQYLRLPWTYCSAEGAIVWIGEDIIELDTDGRIKRVLSFFVF